MKKFLLQNGARLRWLLALASGVLLALAFPKASIAGLAWIAPGMMLFAALGCSGRDAFRLGYGAGLAYFLVSLSWLCRIPFPAGAFAAWLSLSGYCALFPALWVWLSWKFFPSRDRNAPEAEAEGTSRVTWEIEQVSDSCRLTLTHDQMREGANNQLYGGWPMILSGLKTWLETGEPLTTPGSLMWA